MDDLNRLQWSSNGTDNKKSLPMSSTMYSSMRPTPPMSGRSTPFNGATSQPSTKPSTPANDSFASLVSFNSTATNKNLTLQEQQKKLSEQKAQQDALRARQMNAQYGAVPEQFWNNLGSGRSTPAQPLGQQQGNHIGTSVLKQTSDTTKKTPADDDDILAAFNSSAPVDSSSHFPKPVDTPPPAICSTSQWAPSNDNAMTFDNDDDPFGLSQMPSKQKPTSTQEIDDDDVLGPLGKPVPIRSKAEPPADLRKQKDVEHVSIHPQDQAIAELVDMGFPPDKARQALEATDTGLDVQGAVGWLLNQAHAETKQKLKNKDTDNQVGLYEQAREPSGRSRGHEDGGPAWLGGEDRANSTSRRRPTQSSATDRDPAQIASELGSTFLKTAGSLWKQGTKRMQQAVQDFNHAESDSNTPKWMREPPADERQQRPDNRHRERQSESNVTDEALMLESGRSRPAPRQPPRSRDTIREETGSHEPKQLPPAMPSSKLRPQEHQLSLVKPQLSQPVREPPRTNSIKPALTRQAIEEQAASAYTSSARRRKPQTQQSPASEPDLLDASASLAAARPATTSPVHSSPHATSTAATVPSRPRPTAPARTIPNVPSSVMATSNNHRETGTSHFKRGDYAAAHASYTSALSQIPTTHPITIVILTNHALTALRIGEPKTALNDANNALTVIGSSKGEGESITVSVSEPPKPMREYYGKALMRKAEALEQMEKWSEAASVWREAVDGGHGGDISRQGKTRCEKAAGITKPKTSSSTVPARPAAIRKPASAPPKPTAPSQASAAAVSKLREANAAAEKIDDEKFALADSVDAKVNAWKGGKPDNLRALLASLDTVLWPEAGWKKVGMAELVLPNKVKIQYMKGIAKVHPDKIPTTATTEQRMIAGAVFSTLNEAWDKFKKENNL